MIDIPANCEIKEHYHNNGNLLSREYVLNSEKYCDERFDIDGSGALISRMYYRDNKLHRLDGPACEYYHPNKILSDRSYFEPPLTEVRGFRVNSREL